MKSNLTPEQSQRLIDLGVDASKASEDYVGRWEVYSTGTFADPESCEPLFTLTDLLDLLPRTIVNFNELEIMSYDNYWEARYLSYNGFEADELIDALFELLCWVIKSVYY